MSVHVNLAAIHPMITPTPRQKPPSSHSPIDFAFFIVIFVGYNMAGDISPLPVFLLKSQ